MPEKFPEVYTQFVTNILVATLLVGLLILLMLFIRKRRTIQQKEVERLKTFYEKELIQTRLEIQEDVLKNISMELHDNIGQIMLLANINMSIIQTMQVPDKSVPLITETRQLLTKAIDDISQLSRSMHSDRITEMGVFRAITHELELLAGKKIFTVSIENDLPEETEPLSKEKQLVVFRMFQEIIKNILKHAGANAVHFSVHQNKQNIIMSVSDNGKGFDTTVNEKANGIGMRSLKTRAALINAVVEVKSVLQEGTTITIFIPNGTAHGKSA